MISVEKFITKLNKLGVEYFAGVPDSLLKPFCSYLANHIPEDKHIITANEGSAIGLAIGYHMATSKIPLVYLQNSGFGNLINPLLSLADPEIYGIPMIILIGWRGQPGVKDEPQHIKQGRVMCAMLESAEQAYVILDKDQEKAEIQIANAIEWSRTQNAPYFLIAEKDTFTESNNPIYPNVFEMSRETAIASVAQCPLFNKSMWVATTGMISRELFETRANSSKNHYQDFLTVGGMGHASAIALGLAQNSPNKHVVCLDGDGAALMHMGTMSTIGSQKLSNFLHILLNNGAHDSVGGQPTVALDLDWPVIARSLGYTHAVSVANQSELQQALNDLPAIANGPVFLEVRVNRGNRADLGRPTRSPQEAKNAFMTYVHS